MRKLPFLVSIGVLLLINLTSRAQSPELSLKAFRFPEGEAESGRIAFMNLNCTQCHSVADVVLDPPPGERRLHLKLGSKTRFVRTYEDIIIAITNPQHVINAQYRAILTKPELDGAIEPFMPDLTDDMSARQLMDLVAFLDSVYENSNPDYGSPELSTEKQPD